MNYCNLILCLCFVILNIGYCYQPKRQACPPLKLKNGKVKTRPRTFAQFICNKGYLLAGDRYSKCSQGKWDTSPPTCVRPNCQGVPALKNGLIFPSHRGGVVSFYCQAGYNLQGPKFAYCEDARWNTHLPSCLPTNTTASLSCDFETEDICGWSHDLNHNFDWKRMNFKTPSGHLGTGPSHDHTKGPNSNGYYMYIEATSRNINDTARLISPVYNKLSNISCLVFYYHMYGSGIGQLKVYQKKLSDSWVLKPDNIIYSREGNYGNKWFMANVVLGIIDEEFQIIFEGIRGISYVSDIAIDDVSIEKCSFSSTITPIEEDTETTTFVYESCSNKCNQTKTDDMTCNCLYDCYDTNSCCPDFYAVCIVDNTDTSDFATDTDTESTTETIEDTTIPLITSRIITQSSTEVTQKPTLPTQGMSSTARTSTAEVTKTINFNITPTKLSTYSYQNTDDNDNEVLPTNTSTTLRLQTKSTRKPSFTTKRTILIPIKETADPVKTTRRMAVPSKATNPTTSTVRITMTVPTKPTKIPYINDMVNDLTTEETDIVEVPNIPKEYPHEENYPVTISDKAAPIQENPRPTNKTTVIVVLAVCFLIFGILGLIFLAKRYSSRHCVSVRRMRNGNGDSQSDVRFLTSDEILDFRLVTH